MNDTNRRQLTEFIGECWHESGRKSISASSPTMFSCVKCNDYFNTAFRSRTFHTPADMQLVLNRLVETGEWKAFYLNVERNYQRARNIMPHRLSQWLFSETPDGYRLCILCAEFLKQKEGEDGRYNVKENPHGLK